MEWMVRVKTIPVFRSIRMALQDWVWLPSLSVLTAIISRKAACFSLRLLGLQPFFSRPVGRITLFCRIFKSLMCGGSPWCLHKSMFTFHPGCARWISDLPYLLLEAALERSMSASLFRLKPVEDKPNSFLPSRSFWKLCLAMAENPRAWIFSALMEGMYP